MNATIVAAVGAVLLTACGSEKEAGVDGSAPTAGATATAGWNALDACKTLGDEAAAQASGAAVTSAELTTKVEGTAGTAAFSMCTFQLANGGKLMLLTREAPDADATAESIEQARTAGGTLPPAVDVPGLGKAAMWSNTLKQLQVFLDDRRYLAINYVNLPGGGDGKAQAIAVARKLL